MRLWRFGSVPHDPPGLRRSQPAGAGVATCLIDGEAASSAWRCPPGIGRRLMASGPIRYDLSISSTGSKGRHSPNHSRGPKPRTGPSSTPNSNRARPPLGPDLRLLRTERPGVGNRRHESPGQCGNLGRSRARGTRDRLRRRGTQGPSQRCGCQHPESPHRRQHPENPRPLPHRGSRRRLRHRGSHRPAAARHRDCQIMGAPLSSGTFVMV